MLGRLAVSALVATLLGGCTLETVSYAIGEYGEVRGVRVRLQCRDTYEVFDRRSAGRFVVVTNPVNEALAGSCSDAAALPRPERMRRVAEIFLSETTNRLECTLSGQRALSEFHSEFDYRCPTSRPSRSEPSRRR
jgi:hypothetical protein